MNEEQPSRLNRRKIVVGSVLAVALLLAVIFVPPLVSINHYKAQITNLLANSLGRPVHLASVEARLFPRPGFLLTDLTVEEDPAYGAEPILHANEVKASIRLFALWRGKLEIDSISVDEASVNVVHTTDGHWNLDPLLRSAANSAAAGEVAAKTRHLPTLEATHSRINIKNGAEKLPFALTDTKFEFWQSDPGEWRVRLKGQPARTDVIMSEGDTGVLRLEARLHRAPEMRKMPMQVDLEWKKAQLGQLSRMLVGTDAGWRGDVTGNAHLEGTPESAVVKARLRADSVHRAEFAPVDALDFDANCSMTAHIAARGLENLSCDSPLGSGRIHLEGNLPAANGQPQLKLALDRVPVSAGLDALRTLRSGFAEGLEAKGQIGGELLYAPAPPQSAESAAPDNSAKQKNKARAALPQPLTGALNIDGLQLSGRGLSDPLVIGHLSFQPVPLTVPEDAKALAATAQIPAGAQAPAAVTVRFSRSGYQVSLHGQASFARGRELARVVGFEGAQLFDGVASDEPVTVELDANGPWMQRELAAGKQGPTDHITGSLNLRNANWKADYLTNHLEIAQATLHFDEQQLRWDPVLFNYGPIKGTATLTLPAHSDAAGTPQLNVQFGALNTELVQTTFLGAHEKGTMLSTLLERLHPTPTPAWPHLLATVKVDALTAGPVTFKSLTAQLDIAGNHIEASNIEAALLGGKLQAKGNFAAAETAQQKPAYSFEASFEGVQPAAIGQLVALHATGNSLDGKGKIELHGFTSADLAASAKGSLHFVWNKGAITPAPQQLQHFDKWTADAEIAHGAITLGQNALSGGKSQTPVQGSVSLGDVHKASFAGVTASGKR